MYLAEPRVLDIEKAPQLNHLGRYIADKRLIPQFRAVAHPMLP
jgi:hypothetical protein